jgi:phosphoribosylaminoimidazole-succinocarboxamide synthase
MIKEQAISRTDYPFEQVTDIYRGKVRDVYTIADVYLVMVATDRISAFDHILPAAIPYKGQVLNQIAAYFLQATTDIVPNWVEAVPAAHITVGKKCEPLKVEMVVRGYLSGHAWREYKAGKREICGVEMPDGMKENDRFPKPIITPTTKASEGHDEDISSAEIIRQGILTEEQWKKLSGCSLSLFERGTEMAAKQDLILVDTKYEFGLFNGEILLIDEIHTPDSSRYFYKEGYERRQQQGEKQKQLSKEFVREWLIQHGFQGLEGQQMPTMPADFILEISERYIELFEKISGKKFIPSDYNNQEQKIVNSVNQVLRKLLS